MDRSIQKIVVGPVPKYRQLLIIIRNQILNGEILPGERMPSEEELVKAYNLSRGTVRKAIAQLEAERLIETEHGIGSFVRAFHPNAIPFHLIAPTQNVRESQAGISYEIVHQEKIPASLYVAEELKLSIGSPVIHIARRKLVGGVAVSFTERYLNEEILPTLVYEDLTKIGSIHDLLIGESEYPLLRTEIEIEAHRINAEEAHQLNAQVGDSAIVVHRMTYTAPNRPAVSYYGLFKNMYYIGVGIQ